MTVRMVGIITLAGAFAIAFIAWFVATRQPAASADEVRQGIYRVRRSYFVALTSVLLLMLALTLPRAPYGDRGSEPAAVTLVADGVTWAWMIRGDGSSSPATAGNVVPVGRPVRFDVGALDVNHGFGVYTPDGKLLGQVQAMPGYRNEVTLTFPKPGTYRVLCMEYCGVGHHMMFTSLEAR